MSSQARWAGTSELDPRWLLGAGDHGCPTSFASSVYLYRHASHLCYHQRSPPRRLTSPTAELIVCQRTNLQARAAASTWGGALIFLAAYQVSRLAARPKSLRLKRPAEAGGCKRNPIGVATLCFALRRETKDNDCSPSAVPSPVMSTTFCFRVFTIKPATSSAVSCGCR